MPTWRLWVGASMVEAVRDGQQASGDGCCASADGRHGTSTRPGEAGKGHTASPVIDNSEAAAGCVKRERERSARNRPGPTATRRDECIHASVLGATRLRVIPFHMLHAYDHILTTQVCTVIWSRSVETLCRVCCKAPSTG